MTSEHLNAIKAALRRGSRGISREAKSRTPLLRSQLLGSHHGL